MNALSTSFEDFFDLSDYSKVTNSTNKIMSPTVPSKPENAQSGTKTRLNSSCSNPMCPSYCWTIKERLKDSEELQETP